MFGPYPCTAFLTVFVYASFMIKLIVFDWDDVITLGSKEGYYACYRETLKELGVLLDEDELHQRIQRKWGQPFREELKELLLEKPQLVDKANELTEKKFWGDTFVHALSEVTGVNAMLKELHETYTLAVATGNHPKMLRDKIMPSFHIPDVFSQIITSFDIPLDKTKPDPYMLEQIMNTQGFTSAETIYVGDATNDVIMAQQAHVEPIVVLTGHLTRMKAQQLGVTTIIPKVTDLEAVLASRMK